MAAPATCPGVPRARIRQCRVPVASDSQASTRERSSRMEGRSIGLDVHRDFCEVAICDGATVRRAPRVAARPEPLEQFAQQLGPQDRVALEATGNALAIARIIRPQV